MKVFGLLVCLSPLVRWYMRCFHILGAACINSPRKTVTPINSFSQKTSQVPGEGFITAWWSSPDSCDRASGIVQTAIGEACGFHECRRIPLHCRSGGRTREWDICRLSS
ncbi:hypothetical protein EDD15DRAFT_1306409 [Pisolithus albus]|nr:hypothetical protein EDD15DRAFT_1306409 [Pisolithus albus]